MSREVSRDEGADSARLRQVYEAAVSRQSAQAAQLAQAALDDGLRHPLLYNVLAARREEEGRVREAEALLRRGLQETPADPMLRNALGLNLMRQQCHAEALLEFESLLEHESSMPFLHASRGAALFALARPREAESAFRRALEVDPRQGVALAGLATLAAARGAYPAARTWASQALEVLHGYPDAELALAAADLGERQHEAAEARLRALLARPLQPETHAYGWGLLGDVLDARGMPAEAFDAYSMCNHTLHRVHASRFEGQTSALDYALGMQEAMERTLGQWRAPLDREPRPTQAGRHVFLLGFPRSGTTLLEVILEGHPDVVSLEERELLIDGVRQYMQQPQDVESLLAASPGALEGLREAYFRQAEKACAEEGTGPLTGRIFIDKYPLNTLKLPLIARLFPGAKILFACRDPRDIVLSCFRHRFRMSAPIYELLSLEGAARYYDAVMRLMVTVSAALPLDICLVRHEDIVNGFRREMKRICDFLGIVWDPAMGDFALRTQNRATVTPSTPQLMKGLSTEGLGQWRRYRRELAPVLPILAPWVERFYYDAD
jgi:tetratricopeptide (TPR) repeat protein